MAIDLALGTGGQPNSRSRRSDAAPIDTGQVTERSRDVPRQVTQRDGGADGLSSISDALGSFFPVIEAAAKHDTEQEIIEIKRENAEETARLEAEVRAKPKEAREALKTGRFDAFIPDSEMRRRRVIQDGFKSMVGQQMAYDDFHAELKPLIDATPLDGNPDDAVAEYVKKNTEGADPMFARDYGRTIEKMAAKTVSQFRESRLELQQLQAMSGATEVFKQRLENGDVPATWEGYVSARREMIAAQPVNAAEAVTRSYAAFDQAIIDMAAAGNPTALKLAEVDDQERDGTSLIDRNPGAISEAVKKLLSVQQSVRSLAAADDLDRIEQELSNYKAGEGDKSPSQLLAEVFIHRTQYGDSEAHDRVRDAVVQALDDNSIITGALRAIGEGHTVNVSNADWGNKVVPVLMTERGLDLLMSQGMTREQAHNMRIRAVATRGSGTQMVNVQSAALLGSTDAEEVDATFTHLKQLHQATDRPLEDLHLNRQATGLFHAMLAAEKGKKNPIEWRKKLLETAGMTEEGWSSYDSHFEDQPLIIGHKKGEVQGRAGVTKLAVETWANADAGSLGWPGRVYGINKPDYDELSPVARDIIKQAINNASWALQGDTSDPTQVSALATELMRGRLGPSMDSEGNIIVTVDQTPALSVNKDGKLVKGIPLTKEILDRGRIALTEGDHAPLIEAFGGFGGLGVDPQTKAGNGAVVQIMVGGRPQAVNFRYGQRFPVPMDHEATFPPEIFEVVSEDATSNVRVLKVRDAPTDGTARVTLGPNLFAVPVRETDGWSLRLQDPGAVKTPPITTEEVGQTFRDKVQGEEFDKQALQGTIDRRLSEGATDQGNFGDPSPGPDDKGPTTEGEKQGWADGIKSAIDDLIGRGVVSSDAALEAQRGDTTEWIEDPVARRASIIDRMERATMAESNRGGTLDDLTSDPSNRFMRKTGEFLEQWEGRVGYVYDDDAGKRSQWDASKKKGDPTVGIGFNMTRPDARKLIAEVGADYDKLMDGTQQLSDPQIDHLLQLSLRDTMAHLKNKFEGVPLSNNQWMALVSLAMNSRWDKNGPTLIGPKITKAIHNRDWEAVSYEITQNSSGNVKPQHRVGVDARRKDEDNLFRGARPKKDDTIQGGSGVKDLLGGASQDLLKLDVMKKNLPVNARAFALSFTGDKDEINADFLNPDELTGVKEAVKLALSEGRSTLKYSDWDAAGWQGGGPLFNTETLLELYQKSTNNMAHNLMTTFGAASITKNAKGETIVEDVYDFNSQGHVPAGTDIDKTIRAGEYPSVGEILKAFLSGDLSAYSALRTLGGSKGPLAGRDKGIPIRINVGKID